VAIALQPIGLALQDLLRFRADVGAVVGKKDAVAGGRREILLRAGAKTRGAAEPPGTDAAGALRGRRAAAAGHEEQERSGDGGKANKHDQLSSPGRNVLLLMKGVKSAASAAGGTRPG